MRRPMPVIWLLARTQKRNREQREQLHEDDRLIDTLERALAVQTRRAERWEHIAMELAPQVSVRAMEVCLMAAQSDEIASLPEAGPRTERRAG